ncbi:PucR family transcriptional regulator, partial [Rhodococcus jostii]
MTSGTTPTVIVGLMGDVAESMLAELDQFVEDMDAEEVKLAPALGADAAIAAEMSASNRANVARLL